MEEESRAARSIWGGGDRRARHPQAFIGMPLTSSLSPGSGKSRDQMTPFTIGFAVVIILHFMEPLIFRSLE